MKMRIQEYQDPVQQISEEEEILRDNRERRLPPIKEFQRDYRAGKASTRIRCAQKIVTQLETSPSPRATSAVTISTSSASSCGRVASKRPAAAPPKMSVVQEVQKSKKEKEREKEREKAEKARQKEEEKAEKTRQKEAKKLAKEEKKRAKKEAKARRKEAEEAPLLRDEK